MHVSMYRRVGGVYYTQMSVHEGTGTRPNYLVNCANKKNEGPFGEQNRNREIVGEWTVEVVGA